MLEVRVAVVVMFPCAATLVVVTEKLADSSVASWWMIKRKLLPFSCGVPSVVVAMRGTSPEGMVMFAWIFSARPGPVLVMVKP